MKLNTRFLVTIFATVLGGIIIAGVTTYLLVRVNRLNQADGICQDTIRALKELQLETAELLVTDELDSTVKKWRKAHAEFHSRFRILNRSPIIHSLLDREDQASILDSMNAFWIFTLQKTSQVEQDLSGLLNRENPSRDGLIYQYADTNDRQILAFRNDVISAKYFLQSEFETTLASLIAFVDREKRKRLKLLYYQFALGGVIIILIVSIPSISFLMRLKSSLGKLHLSMEKIGRGDFSEKLNIPGNDELSRIAEVINRTTDRLSDTHLELSQRIEELSLAKNEADRANRAKSTFLASMSHEIRTPLNAVTGFSELLTSLVTDKTQQSYLSAIKQAGRTLLTLINDILDLSKIEAGQLEIQYASTDLRQMLDDVRQIFALQALKKEIALISNVGENLPRTLWLDEIRLRQILLNLVGNAVKFTRKGSIKLSAEAVERRDDTIDLLISIEDTGIGIAESELEKIFEAFRQHAGQDISVFGGTGLGLTISRRLVEMMNGRIFVKSSPGQGSVFSVLLRDIAFGDDVEQPDRRNSEQGITRFEKRKILVVDDDPSNRDFLRELLGHANLEVHLADNGRDAVSMSETLNPTIIFMNIKMPVMGGIEATEKIRSNPLTEKIPIIAISASIQNGNLAAIRNSGFDDVLPKPINIADLFAILHKYIPTPTAAVQETGRETRLNLDPYTDLSDELQSKLPEIRDILRSDFMPRWKGIKDRLPMEAVRSFGIELEALGNRFDFEFLEAYGKELVSHVNNFDVSEMQSLMNAFPAIIDKLQLENPVK